MTAPTKRQLTALFALFQGRSFGDRRDENGFGPRWSRSVGGAVGRMKERMGEAGWLVYAESRSGRVWYRDELTAAGLRALDSAKPGLDAMAERIAARDQIEAEVVEAAAAEAASAAAHRETRAVARHAKRASACRAILESYQIAVPLSDDQRVALWMAIVERETRL